MNDLYSILPPTRVPVHELPKIHDNPPSFPNDLRRKPSIICFLRHCGCPFSEKAFRQLRAVSEAYGEQLSYFAVSHASRADTQEWVSSLGGEGQITIVIDESRELYGKWGLGHTGLGHMFGWTALTSVFSLAWNEGIYNRPTKGTRWQSSGFFAVCKDGKVVFAQAAQSAGDIPNLGNLAEALAK